jgi:hypothetical protein
MLCQQITITTYQAVLRTCGGQPSLALEVDKIKIKIHHVYLLLTGKLSTIRKSLHVSLVRTYHQYSHQGNGQIQQWIYAMPIKYRF